MVKIIAYLELFQIKKCIFAQVLRLSELKVGQHARIQEIQEGPYKEKLQEMGCIPGVIVKTLFKAPLGDPIAYEMEEYTLSIRKAEAHNVIIKPLNFDFTDGKAE